MILLSDTSASSCLMVGSMEGCWTAVPTRYYLDFVFGTTPWVMLGDLGVKGFVCLFVCFIIFNFFVFILYCGSELPRSEMTAALTCHQSSEQLNKLNSLILTKSMQTRGRWEQEEEKWREPKLLKHLCLSVPCAIAYPLERRLWQANENKYRPCQRKNVPRAVCEQEELGPGHQDSLQVDSYSLLSYQSSNKLAQHERLTAGPGAPLSI